MPLLLAALTLLLRWQSLDQNLAPFTERFNEYSDRYRLVMLVSPT